MHEPSSEGARICNCFDLLIRWLVFRFVPEDGGRRRRGRARHLEGFSSALAPAPTPIRVLYHTERESVRERRRRHARSRAHMTSAEGGSGTPNADITYRGDVSPMVNFVAAVAYHFCLDMPATFL